jgi:hypothetical protein
MKRADNGAGNADERFSSLFKMSTQPSSTPIKLVARLLMRKWVPDRWKLATMTFFTLINSPPPIDLLAWMQVRQAHPNCHY